MTDQWWSWALTGIGFLGFFLIGRHVWWAWNINLFAQGMWLTYAISSGQYGFFIGSLAYAYIFSKNSARWTQEHKEKKPDEEIQDTVYNPYKRR